MSDRSCSGKKGGALAAPLILGAVKSFMGHCETAAGIIGLLQPLVALVHLQTTKAGRSIHSLSTMFSLEHHHDLNPPFVWVVHTHTTLLALLIWPFIHELGPLSPFIPLAHTHTPLLSLLVGAFILIINGARRGFTNKPAYISCGTIARPWTEVMHLTALNPHVSNVVKATAAASARGGNGVSASIMAPRQTSASVSLNPIQRSSTGVGAFAFQAGHSPRSHSSLNSMSGLVSKLWYRIPFNQSELTNSKIPPTDSTTVRPGRCL